MNILLINPSQEAVYGKIGAINQPHMGLAYIAAVLEKDKHTVSIIDMDFEGVDQQKLADIIRSRKIALVGITATSPVMKNAIEIAHWVKAADPGVVVVTGGIHATIMPHSFAEESAIDFVVRGEGENTIRCLVEAIGTGSDTSRIAGLTYKKGQQFVDNPDRELIQDLDGIPFPARHLFSAKQYRYPDTLYYPAFSIYTSRGCSSRCTFCQAKNLYGYRPRFRSAASVVEEVEMLVKNFHAKEIHVWDDNFAANKERVFAVRDEIKRRKVVTSFSFNNGIRVDTATDERVLQAMKDMGGYSIAFGIESGSPDILKKVCKGINLDQARKAVKAAKKIGFEVWCFFILGFPDDNEQTISQTIEFAKELDPDVAKFHILKPYPSSIIYEEMKKDNLLEDLNYENYGIHTFPVHHTRYLKREQIYALQKKAYRLFYFRPSIMFKQLLRLKSKDRIVNNIRAAIGVVRLLISKS